MQIEALSSVQGRGAAAAAERTAGPRELRYMLSLLLHEEHRTMTVPDLVHALARRGVTVHGRASKTVSDALRWEVEHGRVVRLGRGRYRAGRIPRSTMWWLARQVEAMRTGTVLAPGGYKALP